MIEMKIWIVMIEQHYANYVSVYAVCDSLETAEKIREDSHLGKDVHIYEATMNETHPTV